MDVKKKLKEISNKIIKQKKDKENAKKNLPIRAKKAKEFWKKNFKKDVEYAKELKLIAVNIKENTDLGFYLDYDIFWDKNTYGFIRFGIDNDEVKLEQLNDEVLSITVSSVNPKYNHHQSFRIEHVKKCKERFIEEILHMYNYKT